MAVENKVQPVAEVVSTHEPVPMRILGFPGFLPTGSLDYLFTENGLSAEGIAAAARRAIQRAAK